MNKKSFILYDDLCEIFEELSDEEAGRLIKTICFADYKPDKITKLLFHPFKKALQRDQEKYDKICIRNSENINKRYATKSTTGSSGIPKATKSTDNGNVNENGNGNGNGKDIKEKIYKKEIFDNCFSFYPKRQGSNSKENAYKQWKARLKENHTEEEMTGGVKRYQIYCNETQKTGSEYVMMASTFLGVGKHFINDWSINNEQQRQSNGRVKTAREHNADVAGWCFETINQRTNR